MRSHDRLCTVNLSETVEGRDWVAVSVPRSMKLQPPLLPPEAMSAAGGAGGRHDRAAEAETGNIRTGLSSSGVSGMRTGRGAVREGHRQSLLSQGGTRGNQCAGS